ncbi:tRNA (adenosine(37)-N6)-threonylcarbamoyltransferase complex transferase subunit TsaD [Verrucomicrobiota bacterium]
MRILGIETSCDETAAAVVEDGGKVLSSVVYTQIAKHRPYGGVVPEIACRDHVRKLPGIVEEALKESDSSWDDIDAIAVTYGPGLGSSLLVGLSGAKALALRTGKPLIGVNHLEGHLNSIFLADDVDDPYSVCPMLVLLVSGGHTFVIHVEKPGSYTILGKTYDDAAGEALDKGANLLNLGYPGGPYIEKEAAGGDVKFYHFPRGLGSKGPAHLDGNLNRKLCFSFSGLKTSLLYYLKNNPTVIEDGHMSDVCASYQEAVCDALIKRVDRALDSGSYKAFACVGGVAKNKTLRRKMERRAKKHGVRLLLTPMQFCTDNAAMIAYTGLLRYQAGAAVMNPSDINPNLTIESWR